MQPVDTPEAWGHVSAQYDDTIAHITGDYVEGLIDRLDVRPESRALEVAAGTGVATVKLAPRVASLLATDFAPGMVERLEARVRTAGLSNTTVACMDGTALDVADGSFDRAACCFGVMFFPDRARGFSELRRALVDGGRVAVSGWAGRENFDSFDVFMSAVAEALPDLPPPSGPPPIFSLSDPARFATELEQAGFGEVRVDHLEGVAEVRGVMERQVAPRFASGCARLRNVATVGSGIAI